MTFENTLWLHQYARGARIVGEWKRRYGWAVAKGLVKSALRKRHLIPYGTIDAFLDSIGA